MITNMIRLRLKMANVTFTSDAANDDRSVIDAEYTDISGQQSTSNPKVH